MKFEAPERCWKKYKKYKNMQGTDKKKKKKKWHFKLQSRKIMVPLGTLDV